MHSQYKLVSRVLVALGLSGAGLSAMGLSSMSLASAAEPVRASEASEAAPSATKMLAEAKTILASAERAAQVIGQALREARRTRDVVKSLCLDDKLSQLEVAKLSLTERVASLDGSITADNGSAIDHDFSVVRALGARVGVLSGEANLCIGAEKAAVGEGPSLNVTFSPEIPKQDTSSLPSSPNTSTPPVAASPVI
jgi:hypothetical protein